ncbi:hypothetical protein Pint_25909 [Pistacia integerrima]|uniref:Uncharacterized protein n=1 Tax=Pistacia integerrima TaxID=434235 RepID=A0ACC0YBG4_9ROSI|nr:hypothetical protein Pint_25909 [Pistacia integerrima]
MQAPLLELRERIEGFRVTIEGSILALQSGLKKRLEAATAREAFELLLDTFHVVSKCYASSQRSGHYQTVKKQEIPKMWIFHLYYLRERRSLFPIPIEKMTRLRNGFINVHLAPGSKFNFQKYIKRSLEDDFKIVVGVSPVLWASFVLFLLVNVNGWQALLWASLIPVIIILAIGMELQSILTQMALEITERHAVVQGMPLVQGSDKYFWFGRPHLVLHLIHFALF